MFPLLFIDSKKMEKKKKEAALDGIFLDVVNEAKELEGAEATTIFIVKGEIIYAKVRAAGTHARATPTPGRLLLSG